MLCGDDKLCALEYCDRSPGNRLRLGLLQKCFYKLRYRGDNCLIDSAPTFVCRQQIRMLLTMLK